MAFQNYSIVAEFILLGLSGEPRTQVILFVVFFIVYLISLLGNVLIIFITMTASNLQNPMYFFLRNLSFLDICYSSTVVPRMLKDMLSTTKTISFAECVMQMYIVLSLGECECILLAVIAYDRYIAICYPLHYTTIISSSVCTRIASSTWICGFTLSYASIALTLNVGICGSNEINHFQCEVPEILALGCGNIIMIEYLIFVVGVIILMIPVTFIIISYFKIILAVLKIASSAGQRKALSTCGSHILVVTLFYGSAMATYMKPRSQSSPNTDKMFAIFYTVVTPMLNPLIYTLRNTEVKAALKKITNK